VAVCAELTGGNQIETYANQVNKGLHDQHGLCKWLLGIFVQILLELKLDQTKAIIEEVLVYIFLS
jgi:hypothetical protein